MVVDMAMFYYPAPPVTISGVATEATLLLVETNTADTVTELQTLNTVDFSTEAKQDSQITELQSINTELDSQTTQLTTLNAKDFATQTTLAALNTKVPSQGQAVMTASVPVVIASNQSAVPVSASTLPLPSGAATSALQTTGNTSLSSISGDTSSIAGYTQAIETYTGTLAASYTFDQIDSTPLLDTSLTNIPGSASSVLTVVASLAANINEIQTVEDIGEFIGFYVNGTLQCVLPLGGGSIKVAATAGDSIGLRSMTTSAISTGKIAINFLAF